MRAQNEQPGGSERIAGTLGASLSDFEMEARLAGRGRGALSDRKPDGGLRAALPGLLRNLSTGAASGGLPLEGGLGPLPAPPGRCARPAAGAPKDVSSV